MSETTRSHMSRNPRPGFVQCSDPNCYPAFGHPHYHAASAMNKPPNETTARTWDRECVICACKWLEADEGPKCPDCEDRKYASGEGRIIWKDGRYGR